MADDEWKQSSNPMWVALDWAPNPAAVLRQIMTSGGHVLTPESDKWLSEMEEWLDQPASLDSSPQSEPPEPQSPA